MMKARRKLVVGAALVAFSLVVVTQGARAQQNAKPTDPFPEGALAPDNLTKPRPKAPFDLTGTWMVDLSLWRRPSSTRARRPLQKVARSTTTSVSVFPPACP